jgi:DNA uptake protein ComE-like DNA-binding protein
LRTAFLIVIFLISCLFASESDSDRIEDRFRLQEESDIIEQDVALPKTTFIQQMLEDLIKNPVDLNSADYEDLLKIPYLTPVLAYRIIENRKSKYNFKSVFELTEITGIDKELFERIKSFVTIRQINKTKTSLQIRLQTNLDI